MICLTLGCGAVLISGLYAGLMWFAEPLAYRNDSLPAILLTSGSGTAMGLGLVALAFSH